MPKAPDNCPHCGSKDIGYRFDRTPPTPKCLKCGKDIRSAADHLLDLLRGFATKDR